MYVVHVGGSIRIGPSVLGETSLRRALQWKRLPTHCHIYARERAVRPKRYTLLISLLFCDNHIYSGVAPNVWTWGETRRQNPLRVLLYCVPGTRHAISRLACHRSVDLASITSTFVFRVGGAIMVGRRGLYGQFSLSILREERGGRACNMTALLSPAIIAIIDVLCEYSFILYRLLRCRCQNGCDLRRRYLFVFFTRDLGLSFAPRGQKVSITGRSGKKILYVGRSPALRATPVALAMKNETFQHVC